MTTIEIGIKGRTIDVDFDKIMSFPTVVDAAVRFAVKQALTNTHAGVAKADDPTGEKSMALALKRLAAMYSGEWAQTERGSRVDEETKLIREMAERALLAKAKTIGKSRKDFDDAKWKELVGQQAARKEAEYRAAAKAIMAQKADVADDDVIDL